jgi:predicted DNA-binding transcriptional regulator AlpA
MSTETKPSRKKRGPRKKQEPVFITKTEIANHMGIGSLGTIDDWIAEGGFPPPHSRPGERFAVWRRKHWDAYVETGSWPPSAFPKGSG